MPCLLFLGAFCALAKSISRGVKLATVDYVDRVLGESASSPTTSIKINASIVVHWMSDDEAEGIEKDSEEGYVLSLTIRHSIPDQVYVRKEEVFKKIREKHPSYKDDDPFFCESAGNGLFLIRPFAVNKLHLSYIEDSQISSFTYRQIVYQIDHDKRTYDVCISCESADSTIRLDRFMKNITFRGVEYSYTGEVNNNCNAEGSCREKFIRDGLAHDQKIPIDYSHTFAMMRVSGYCWLLDNFRFLDWGIFSLTTTAYLFRTCDAETINLHNINTSQVTSMEGMFEGCRKLKSITGLSSLDTSKVTTMDGMFYDCSDLQSLDLSGFDTSQVTDMNGMFEECSKLQTLNLSSFDTSRVEDMTFMFGRDEELEILDLSSFVVSDSLKETQEMFAGCGKLSIVYISRETFDILHDTLDGSISEGGDTWCMLEGKTYCERVFFADCLSQ